MKYFIQSFILMGLFLGMNFLASCGSDDAKETTIIEEQEGEESALELVEREFEACQGQPIEDPNTPKYLRRSNDFDWGDTSYMSHSFRSLGEMYPERGSYRQSKAEILDIVDRHMYSPEKYRNVKLLEYFDMVLLLNVAPRFSSTDPDSSAQRMQILVRRKGSTSNRLADWNKVETWPISSGLPCMTASGVEKIATYTGVYKFNPNRLHWKYKSELWDVDMYQTAFLHHRYLNGATTGVAMHGTMETSSLGRRASGGCIRVGQPKMQCLFETINGMRSTPCLNDDRLDYSGTVPSLLAEYGEADPEIMSDGGIEMNGIRVLIAIFNDENDSVNDPL